MPLSYCGEYSSVDIKSTVQNIAGSSCDGKLCDVTTRQIFSTVKGCVSFRMHN